MRFRDAPEKRLEAFWVPGAGGGARGVSTGGAAALGTNASALPLSVLPCWSAILVPWSRDAPENGQRSVKCQEEYPQSFAPHVARRNPSKSACTLALLGC